MYMCEVEHVSKCKEQHEKKKNEKHKDKKSIMLDHSKFNFFK